MTMFKDSLVALVVSTLVFSVAYADVGTPEFAPGNVQVVAPTPLASAPSVEPAELVPLPAPIVVGGPNDPALKGTIGLICVDVEGRTHTWINEVNQEGRREFESCVQTVVQNWARPLSGLTLEAAQVDFNRFLGGYNTYRSAAERARWNLLHPIR